jgi:hypothetical protein
MTGDICTGESRIDRPTGRRGPLARLAPFPCELSPGENLKLIDYVRDEGEQVRYLTDLLEVFSGAGVDSAFWFSFAGFGLPRHDDPRRDLDLASYGVVSILDGGGTRWRPKRSFHALAAAYGQAAAVTSRACQPASNPRRPRR